MASITFKFKLFPPNSQAKTKPPRSSSMPQPTPTQLSNLLDLSITSKLPITKSIHAHILKSAILSLNTFLYNRLIESYSISNHARYVFAAFNSIPRPNILSWNAILSALCKSCNLDDARCLFDKMPKRNAVAWNTLIGSLSRNGCEREGLGLYYRMILDDFVPTHFTFASVLSACGCLAAVGDGRRCHGLVVKVGLERNLFVENALVGMYMKCGCVEDAVRLFDLMTNPNEVSFTAMMGGFVSSGFVEGALRLFARMHERGVHVDPVAVSSVLGACARVEDKHTFDFDEKLLGRSIQALVFKKRFEADPHVGNSLIDMYAKQGELDDAEKIFDTLPGINVVSWNVLIAGYGQKGEGKMAMEMIELMQRSGFEPDELTFISLLGACTKSGDHETAREMFSKIPCPSVLSWNAIISGYCQEDKHQKAIELFRKMQYQHVAPDRTTLAVMLSSCSGLGNLGFWKQLHATSVRSMFHGDMFVASGLVDMYSKCGHIKSARRIFDRMPERDVVSWNSMITGFSLHSLIKEALSFFKLIQEDGLTPTEFSYATVINSCARLNSLSQGRQIHAQIAKNGYDADVHVGSALIDMYSKCGNVDEAQLFFDCMPMKHTVSWNEMILGYAQNGLGEKAITVFEQMLSAEENPDAVTFISVLTACSHSGLADEALKLFESMEKVYRIEPLADHYTCVIDSLGRAGRLKEAEELADGIKWKADPIVWEVLLSSCALHGDARLGRRAAEVLFCIDPKNSAAYVLLSNLYAGLGRWKYALKVRALMSDRGVVKDRGYCWTDQKDGVRAFMVDDGES